MTSPDPDLDELTALLGRCLGRIDEHAFRLQQHGEVGELFLAGDLLEHEADALQQLLGTLLAANARANVAVNAIVERVLQAWLTELGVPILVRQRLGSNLPAAGCTAPELTSAVQRALVLAADGLTPGGELGIATRAVDDAVVVEIDSRGDPYDDWQPVRAETLCEFVADIGGCCRIDSHRGGLLVAIELPRALAAGER